MRTQLSSSCALCLAMLLAAAPPVLGASRHFRASYEHFNEYATKAADLYFKASQTGEKNILSHLTAVSAIYAEKAYVILNLADVLEHMAAKRDRTYVKARLDDVRKVILAGIPQDIKLLGDLVENQDNEQVRAIGNLVVNEMRVFERNTDNQ
ncbi:MAG: hypothetical protein AB7D37_12005 [Desulfovibrio sp.]|uniref:hypothetical protein n=1 Tax=Solidesulfovibrio sp. C21 TaxID=3398613 RepID=UPI0039FB8BC7